MSGSATGERLRPSVQHPLMGARLTNLVRALIANGGVSPRYFGLVGLMGLSAATRSLFHPLEAASYSWQAGRAPPRESPLIILGHWRTGTTHLHNLMGCSPSYGAISPLASGLPDQIMTLGTWLKPMLERALPEDRKVDPVAVTPDSPQEDEIPLANQQPLSVFHALYFPRHFQTLFNRGVFFEGASDADIARWQRLTAHFADKIAVHERKPRLVIKNPVYTARIKRLLAIWPNARFIHIRRNPYEVFVSTCRYYRQLLDELALQPSGSLDIEGFVLETFKRLMAAYEAERSQVPQGHLAEVSYEQLCDEPLPLLETLHDQLGLPGWRETRPRIADYLKQISDYRTNAYNVSNDAVCKVDAHWAGAVAEWKERCAKGLSSF